VLQRRPFGECAIFENPIAIATGDIHDFHCASALLLRGAQASGEDFSSPEKVCSSSSLGHLQHPGVSPHGETFDFVQKKNIALVCVSLASARSSAMASEG